ncbi:hypothetical protein PF_00024 [Pseudomonas phage P413]|uniref:Uncharacterized protein n=1 Tax=Pseudomonas phage Ghual01 TaxID=3138534 RepID=A0AAU6VZT5_9CAUD|nr:hypothetical protein PF_00024 [Pseudomonas phage P413]
MKIRKLILALAHKAIAAAHTIIVREQAALEKEAADLYIAASNAYKLASQKATEALEHKFHAQDVERAKKETVTK